jgi:hypothetical protein
MNGDAAARLFAAVAGQEPEELRASYLATPTPGQLLGVGTTTPIISTPMERRPDGLLVPMKGPGAQVAEMSVVVMTHETLFGHRLPGPIVGSLLRTHSREALLSGCAALLANLYDRHPTDIATHAQLIQALPPTARKRAELLIKNGWRFISPQAVTAVIKAILLTGAATQTAVGPTMGSALLLSLEFASVVGLTETPDDDPGWRGVIGQALAVEMCQNQLFNHASYFASAAARWRETRDLAAKYNPADAAYFDKMFEEETGCSPEVLFEVGLIAELTLRHLHVVRIPAARFTSLHHPQAQVDAALRLLATDVDSLAELVRTEVDEENIDWAANSLRRYPLLRCEDGDFVVLNPQFLIERACGSGFFWQTRFAINQRISASRGAARRAAKELEGRFGDLTGHAAEEYAGQRLARIAPDRGAFGRQLWRQDDLRKLWSEGKICDFLIDGGASWVAIEVVNHAISAGAYADGSVDVLMKDLEYIIDEKADQLNETILRLIEEGGALPGGPSRVPYPYYHPVIVAASGFPWSPLMAAEVHGRLKELGLLQHALIRPLTVVTTDELEFLESAVERGCGTFAEMLDYRHRFNLVGEPFDVFLHGRAGLQVPQSLLAPMTEATRQTAVALGLDPDDVQLGGNGPELGLD